jgi:hypothetical protein
VSAFRRTVGHPAKSDRHVTHKLASRRRCKEISLIMSAGRMVMNDALERIWKEIYLVCFKALSHQYPGGAE